jgi:hypothetical protein
MQAIYLYPIRSITLPPPLPGLASPLATLRRGRERTTAPEQHRTHAPPSRQAYQPRH